MTADDDRAVGMLMRAILGHGAIRATKYISEKHTIKATRKRYKKGVIHNAIDIVITIGKPNYLERAFIKKHKQAGGTFPVKKLQLKWDVPR
jgi:hypothetical protein